MSRDLRCFDYCDEPLPCQAGQSPFHIKGEFYRHTVKALSRYEKSGSSSVFNLMTPDVRDFCRQSFLAGEWYDVLPYPRLAMAEALYLARDLRQHTHEKARRAAVISANGVYRLLLKITSTHKIGARMVSAIHHFYDFGQAVSHETNLPNTVVIERKEVPLCMIEWWCIVAIAYMEATLEALGFECGESRYDYVPQGERSGIAVGRATVIVCGRNERQALIATPLG